jgi:hypothetical protein
MRGPIRDSERCESNVSVEDDYRLSGSVGAPLIPTFSPHRGEKEQDAPREEWSFRCCHTVAIVCWSISPTLFTPASAMVMSSSLRMISIARATPSCPPAPSP